MKPDGSLEAIDIYHKLTDSSGNVLYVPFRYYTKEIPTLVSSLKQYPQVQTWQNIIGLQEEITVVQKTTGNYMRISSRHALLATVSSASTVPSTSSQPPKSVGIAPKFGSKRGNKPSPASKASLLLEDDDFDDWEEDENED